MKRIFILFVIVIQLTITHSLNGQDMSNCFLEDFELKIATIPPFIDVQKTTSEPTITITSNVYDTLAKVSKYIYGNNANTWMSQMVTETELIEYIKKLSPHLIRYPGGNISNIFFWDAPVNRPPDEAPSVLIDGNTGQEVSAGYWYGKNTASWTLSVDNYYKMLEMTGNKGVITINYSYARYGIGPDPVATAAKYAANWVRYDNGRTKFWEIGNENAGPWQAGFRIDTTKNQDDQPEIISGELYGKHFKVFADSMRKAAEEIGTTIYIGAQLIQYDARNSWNPPDRTWNAGFFSQAGDAANFFIIHTYFTPYNQNSTASVILNSATTESRNMMEYMKRTSSENGALLKPVALTEWNIFAIGSKQSCSFINGMHATLVLGELATNEYGMSCRWDLANGYDDGDDHGMFNKGDEPGVPKWNPRPVFFYMYYFQKYFGDHTITSSVSGSRNVLAYVSIFSSGELSVVAVNKGTSEETVRLDIKNYGVGERYYIYSLTGGDDNGEFSQCVYVNDYGPDNATGGPIEDLENLEAFAYPMGDEIKFTSPGRSVQFVLIESGDHYLSVEDHNIRQTKNNMPRQIEVYPNPTSNSFKIDLRQGGFNRIDIFDIRGRVVYSKNIDPSETILKLRPDLVSGHYFIKLYNGKNISIKKLIITK
jgi:hypothetical protein